MRAARCESPRCRRPVDNQAFGVLAALAAAGVDPASLDAIVHGTTTTTNAMLERKIATVGLITTKGFATSSSSAGARGRRRTA
jgi:N-methylhydantoinase A/oxoprolinase/acetone carboxylase beta subunit